MKVVNSQNVFFHFKEMVISYILNETNSITLMTRPFHKYIYYLGFDF